MTGSDLLPLAFAGVRAGDLLLLDLAGVRAGDFERLRPRLCCLLGVTEGGDGDA